MLLPIRSQCITKRYITRPPAPSAPLYTQPMGAFEVRMTVSTLSGENPREVDALVDTGSRRTMLPGDVLREMDTPVRWRRQFERADGRVVEMDVGEARVAVNGMDVATQVIFGPDGCQPLLGAITLQELDLMVDVPNERLRRDLGPFHL